MTLTDSSIQLPDDIPLPERPGSLWSPNLPGATYCTRCGQTYSRHGAPEDVAKQFNVPNSKRHLICPASDEAWTEYNRLHRRATVDLFVADVRRDLQKFDEEDRIAILAGIGVTEEPPLFGNITVDTSDLESSLKKIEALTTNPHWTAERRWMIAEIATRLLRRLKGA